jgi:hypothetical protein
MSRRTWGHSSPSASCASIARAVKPQLITWIRQARAPLASYAMYCLAYALDASDRDLLVELAQRGEPEIRDLATQQLQKLPAP